MKRSLLRWLGLLGVLSFLSYTAAVLLSAAIVCLYAAAADRAELNQ